MEESAGNRSLRKRDVETLMDSYDSEPVASLMVAISALTGRQLETWSDAVELVPCAPEMRAALVGQDTTALDALVKRLVETRSLEQ